MTLAPDLEERLAQSVQSAGGTRNLVLEPALVQGLLEAIGRQAELMAERGLPGVVLCSVTVRAALRRLIERALPNVAVISFAEIAPDVEVQSEAVVRVGA
jgi:flagellar biosynthesis protein FlhA